MSKRARTPCVAPQRNKRVKPKGARSRFEELLKFRSMRAQRLPPPMSSHCPFFSMKDDYDLFVRTMRVVISVHDQFKLTDVTSKKYLHAMLRKCHPDKFAANIAGPTSDYSRWKTIVDRFTAALLDISNIATAKGTDFERIKLQLVEYLRCIKSSRRIVREEDGWSRFDHCDTFEEFLVECKKNV